MLRKLLACLALLTGLAAAGAPAQAGVAVTVTSRMEAAAEGTATRDQAVAAPTRRTVPRKTASAPGTAPLLRTVLRVRTVQLGGDRARE